jgi:hypothetical protein
VLEELEDLKQEVLPPKDGFDVKVRLEASKYGVVLGPIAEPTGGSG